MNFRRTKNRHSSGILTDAARVDMRVDVQVRPTRPVPGLAPPPAEEDLLDIFRGLNLQDEVPSWGAFPHDTPPG